MFIPGIGGITSRYFIIIPIVSKEIKGKLMVTIIFETSKGYLEEIIKSAIVFQSTMYKENAITKF